VKTAVPIPLDRYLPIVTKLWRGMSGAGAGRRRRGPTGSERLSDTELHDAARAVRDLSRGFTGDRGLAGASYMDDPRLLGGYLLFYWPVSYAQTWAAALSAGITGRFRGARETRILDLGCGPGPSGFALQDIGYDRVTAADSSTAALGLLRAVARETGRRIDARRVGLTEPGAAGLLSAGGPYDLVMAMHTLNELWPGRPDRIALRLGLLRGVAGLLGPAGRLLVVEPALTATANEAISVRDGLVAGGWTVESPCTFAGRCPALPNGTCHAEVDWEPPKDLVRLAHAARIGREALAFTYFLLAPPRAAESASATLPAGQPLAAAGSPAGSYRVVSERFLSKSGRLRFLICGPEGRFPLSMDGRGRPRPGMGERTPLSMDGRGRPRPGGSEMGRAFRGLCRYDLIQVQSAEKRETGYGLTEESVLRVLSRAPSLSAEGRGRPRPGTAERPPQPRDGQRRPRPGTAGRPPRSTGRSPPRTPR
jgi:SAM-dependent methyltransferase